MKNKTQASSMHIHMYQNEQTQLNKFSINSSRESSNDIYQMEAMSKILKQSQDYLDKSKIFLDEKGRRCAELIEGYKIDKYVRISVNKVKLPSAQRRDDGTVWVREMKVSVSLYIFEYLLFLCCTSIGMVPCIKVSSELSTVLHGRIITELIPLINLTILRLKALHL